MGPAFRFDPPHVKSSTVPPPPHFETFGATDTNSSVPRRFENQVARFPNHVAVKTASAHITYGQLNSHSNRLAHAIHQRASDRRPIALLLKQGSTAITAIIAVLKTGAPFVPLDAALPASRLQYMLDDVDATLIVTDDQCLEPTVNLARHNRGFVNLDRLDPGLPKQNLDVMVSPDDLSCILYTSGSTGVPKGVIHSHRNELHNALHHTNSLAIGSLDRLTLLASYSTGQGMQDIYGALLNGAALYPWDLKTDGLSGFAAWLRLEKITVYHSAATVFRNFVKSLACDETFPDLRVVRLGSEHVTWRDFELFKERFGDRCYFVNALSSSETKTIRQCVLSRDAELDGTLPAGYAVEGVDVLIVDEDGRDLGSETVGEIAVRSRYLTLGYWRQPELTSAVFQNDPADPDSPCVSYRRMG